MEVLANQSDIRDFILENPIQPIKDDHVRQPLVVYHAVTICAFGGGKFSTKQNILKADSPEFERYIRVHLPIDLHFQPMDSAVIFARVDQAE